MATAAVVRLSVTAIVLLSAAAKPAHGYTDNFNTGTDAGWTRYDPNFANSAGAPGTWSFPGGNTYEIQAGTAFLPLVSPARAASLRLDQTYTQFAESVDVLQWDSSHDMAAGLLARITSLGFGTSNGYSLTYSTGQNELDISKIGGENAFNLAKTKITLTDGHPYTFLFTGVGSQLTGTVFDDANPAVPIALATITATDATWTSGSGGILVFDNTSSSTAAATFDNYGAGVTLPEPTAGCFLVCLSAIRLLRPRHVRVCR